MSLINKTKLNNKGFSHLEIGITIVVVAVIAVVGGFVYSKNSNKSKAMTTSSSDVSYGLIPQNELSNITSGQANGVLFGSDTDDNTASNTSKGLVAKASSRLRGTPQNPGVIVFACHNNNNGTVETNLGIYSGAGKQWERRGPFYAKYYNGYAWSFKGIDVADRKGDHGFNWSKRIAEDEDQSRALYYRVYRSGSNKQYRKQIGPIYPFQIRGRC